MVGFFRSYPSFLREGETSRASLSSLNGFVGGDLSRTPYLSPFGALLKLTRLNQLAKADIYAAFGFRLMSHEDPSQVLAFSTKRLSSFSRSIGLVANVRRGWRLTDWLPFQGDSVKGWRNSWRTRVCLACAREGFHSWLFQLPWETLCPWHSTRLVEACPSCHRPLALGFSRGLPLLRCECGIDFFDRRTALMAEPRLNRARDQALAECLDQAEVLRTTQYLLSPTEQFHASNALTVLVRGSPAGRRSNESCVHTFQSRCGLAQASFDADQRRSLAILGKQFEGKNGTISELPSSMIPPMRKVAHSIATRVPLGSLVPAEAERLVLDGMIATKVGTSRIDILYLPVQTGGDRSYLFTNSLPPSVLSTIGSLIQVTRDKWIDEESACQVHAALRSLLLRAYADGLRIVLSRYVPELYDHPRLAPWEHIPWVMVTIDTVGVSKVHIVWTRENLGGRLS